MDMNCPLCDNELSVFDGEKMHPGDNNYGVTLSCLFSGCPAQEVMGHGKDIKQAMQIIIDKYVK